MSAVSLPEDKQLEILPQLKDVAFFDPKDAFRGRSSISQGPYEESKASTRGESGLGSQGGDVGVGNEGSQEEREREEAGLVGSFAGEEVEGLEAEQSGARASQGAIVVSEDPSQPLAIPLHNCEGVEALGPTSSSPHHSDSPLLPHSTGGGAEGEAEGEVEVEEERELMIPGVVPLSQPSADASASSVVTPNPQNPPATPEVFHALAVESEDGTGSAAGAVDSLSPSGSAMPVVHHHTPLSVTPTSLEEGVLSGRDSLALSVRGRSGRRGEGVQEGEEKVLAPPPPPQSEIDGPIKKPVTPDQLLSARLHRCLDCRVTNRVCCAFPRRGGVVRCFNKTAVHPWFENVILVAIFVNSILLAMPYHGMPYA